MYSVIDEVLNLHDKQCSILSEPAHLSAGNINPETEVIKKVPAWWMTLFLATLTQI